MLTFARRLGLEFIVDGRDPLHEVLNVVLLDPLVREQEARQVWEHSVRQGCASTVERLFFHGGEAWVDRCLHEFAIAVKNDGLRDDNEIVWVSPTVQTLLLRHQSDSHRTS